MPGRWAPRSPCLDLSVRPRVLAGVLRPRVEESPRKVGIWKEPRLAGRGSSGFFQTPQRGASAMEVVSDGGINFVVKNISKCTKKIITLKDAPSEKKDPFLPPFEDGAWIAELSATHDLIFNKYPVSRGHVLVITKEFQA